MHAMDDRPIRVLLCEDNMVSRLIAEAACTHLGCEVVSRETVAAALQEIGESGRDVPFDLVLTDMHLVGESGLDLIRSIRAEGLSGFRLPAAVMTAQPGAADEAACYAAGGQFVLAKPISETALADIIERTRPLQGSSEGERILHDMQLVHRYQQALLATRAALTGPVEPMIVSGEPRSRLITLLHELAGVGSLFGNPALAAEANALESELRADLPEGVAGYAARRDIVLDLLKLSILPEPGVSRD